MSPADGFSFQDFYWIACKNMQMIQTDFLKRSSIWHEHLCTVDFIATKLFPEEDAAGFLPDLHENQLQDEETIPTNQDHNNEHVI